MGNITPQYALNLHQNGQLAEALGAYDQLLHSAEFGTNGQIWLLRGGALSQMGREDQALESFQQATKLEPQNPEFLLEYANSLLRLNQNALALQTLAPLCSGNSADITSGQPQTEPSISAAANYSAGRACEKMQDFTRAITYYSATLAIDGQNTQAALGLASCLSAMHEFDKAKTTLQQILQSQPDNPQALLGIASCHIASKDYQQAQNALHTAIHAAPEFAEAYDCLSFCMQKLGDYDKAAELSQKALKLAPNNPEILYSCASLELAFANAQNAAELLQKAVNIEPNNPKYFSKLLLTLHYFDSLPPEQIYELHRKWAQIHGQSKTLKSLPENLNQNNSDSVIRIGFVSPDFCQHPVSFFILPVIRSLLELKCEVYCYSNTAHHDPTTKELQELCTGFYDIKTLNDQTVAELIASHNIDLLIDLAGHTPGNRLGIFTYRPAKKSATYLGYPDTTGLSCIDYRIVDAITDPDKTLNSTLETENTEYYCSEEIIKAAGCFLSYNPPLSTPEPAPRPYHHNGYVTFGSFNNISKLSFDTINCWVKILSSVKNSRLILKSNALSCDKIADNITKRFSSQGIDPARITCLGKTPTLYEHFEQYSLIDIALDTFPYNGTTTTFDALWMGVPVICLKGNSHHSRVSASILQSLQLGDLTNDNCNDYLQCAISLANNSLKSDNFGKISRERIMLNLQATPIAQTIYNLGRTGIA